VSLVTQPGRSGETQTLSFQERIGIIHNPQALSTSNIWIDPNGEES